MRTTWDAFAMSLGGPSLKERRELAGFPGRDGRERFAQLVGVSTRTLEGWESSSGHVPTGKEAIVRKLLEGGASGPSLADVSNIDLISALAARLARYEEMERQYRHLLSERNAQQVSNTETGAEGNDPAYGVRTSENATNNGVGSGTNSSEPPQSGWGPLT